MGGRGPWGLGRSSRKPLASRSESMYPCCRYLRSLSMGKECSVRAKETFVKVTEGIVRVDQPANTANPSIPHIGTNLHVGFLLYPTELHFRRVVQGRVSGSSK